MSEVGYAAESLRSKIEQLIHLHTRAEEENRRLADQVQELQQTINEKNHLIKELEEKNRIIKLGAALSLEKVNKTELKLNINRLVKEIDKCIGILNR